MISHPLQNLMITALASWALGFAAGAGQPAMAGPAGDTRLMPASIVGTKGLEAQQIEKTAERDLNAGRIKQAVKEFRRALALKTRRYGNTHLEVAKTLLRLAKAELKLGQAEKALAAQQKALAIRQAKLDPHHWLIAAAYNDISETLSILGRFDAAAGAARHDIAIFEKHLGPNHARLGAMWLRYAKLLRRAGREDQAARAETHGHEVYARAPHGGPEVAKPPPELPPEIKTITSGPVTAHFGAEKPDDGSANYWVKALWFTFAHDDGIYPFKPEGTLFFSDWRFDIFSPDGVHVALLQDRFGPYHVVPTARLKAYLRGRAQPAAIVGQKRKTGEIAAVHEDGHWLSTQEFQYTLTCCGTSKVKTHRLRVNLKP
ncbi:MAG: tetratricopeptide repeat protein [Alphaproteobacteria bacterium]